MANKKVPKVYSGNQSHATVINSATENGKPVLRIMGTGSRELSEYPDAENIYKALEKRILEIRAKHMAKTGGDIHLISGMQLGFDEYIARAAVENNIPFTAVVPTKDFGSYYWGKNLTNQGKTSRLNEFNRYLAKAENVIYGESVYGKPEFIKKRSKRDIAGPNFKINREVIRAEPLIERYQYIHANMARNQIMTELSDFALVFDAGTPGTKDAVERLRAAGIRFEKIKRPPFSIASTRSGVDTDDLINYIKTTRTNPVPEIINPIEDIVQTVSNEVSEAIVESVTPIESIAESTIKSTTKEASNIGDIIAETVIDTAKKADSAFSDIAEGILKSRKLKFGALGAAAVGGLGAINRIKAKRDFSEAEKKSRSNMNLMQNKSSMRTFSGTINSGYESLNVLKNKKRS